MTDARGPGTPSLLQQQGLIQTLSQRHLSLGCALMMQATMIEVPKEDGASHASDTSSEIDGAPGEIVDPGHLMLRTLRSGWKKDVMYHLGISSECSDIRAFKDVKVVCMQGSSKRAHAFANKLVSYLGIQLPLGVALQPLFKTERFEIYKTGPVISASHGMGMPSLSILLHEITKLLRYAGATNVLYMRIGTSGGVSLPGGNIVVASESYTSELRPVLVRRVLDRAVERPCHYNHQLVRLAVDAITQSPEQTSTREIEVTVGRTLGVNDFFEEQGRIDGAFAEHSEQEKLAWLNRLHSLGVRNIEMEGPEFAAFTNHCKIPAILLCVTLLDRLKGDQVDVSAEVLESYSHILFEAALRVVKLVVEKGLPAISHAVLEDDVRL